MRRPYRVNKPRVGPTGLCLWSLPDTELQVMWTGPGAGLMLVCDKPRGLMTHIRFDDYIPTYSTRAEAQKAFETFLSRANRQK